jgi:hypothetical protein
MSHHPHGSGVSGAVMHQPPPPHQHGSISFDKSHEPMPYQPPRGGGGGGRPSTMAMYHHQQQSVVGGPTRPSAPMSSPSSSAMVDDRMQLVVDAAAAAHSADARPSPSSSSAFERRTITYIHQNGAQEPILLLALPQDRVALSETLCVVREVRDAFIQGSMTGVHFCFRFPKTLSSLTTFFLAFALTKHRTSKSSRQRKKMSTLRHLDGSMLLWLGRSDSGAFTADTRPSAATG